MLLTNFVFAEPIDELEIAIRTLADVESVDRDGFVQNHRICAFGIGCLLTLYRDKLPEDFAEIKLDKAEVLLAAQEALEKMKSKQELTPADVIYAVAVFQKCAQKFKTFKPCQQSQ